MSRKNFTAEEAHRVGKQIVTGKIALAHLNEFPDYYVRLEKMEEEAEREGNSA
ncbi:MAG TPA: DUF5661 family protein [Solirubrobacterales bacterium]|nr:DUF5661 family protein [Solirubrobacterales bacterium]